MNTTSAATNNQGVPAIRSTMPQPKKKANTRKHNNANTKFIARTC